MVSKNTRKTPEYKRLSSALRFFIKQLCDECVHHEIVSVLCYCNEHAKIRVTVSNPITGEPVKEIYHIAVNKHPLEDCFVYKLRKVGYKGDDVWRGSTLFLGEVKSLLSDDVITSHRAHFTYLRKLDNVLVLINANYRRFDHE